MIASVAAITFQLACGRLGFEQVAVLASDASSDAPAIAGKCNLTAEFAAPQLVPGVSFADSVEATMRLSDDELQGYLWSSRSSGVDLAHVVRADLQSPFQYVPFDELNTPAQEFGPTLSRDALQIVFPRTAGATRDLFHAKRADVAMPFGVAMPLAINSTLPDYQPFLTSTELYFISERDGVTAIYRSQLLGTSEFLAPTRVVELTEPELGDPMLSADGLTIYFSTSQSDSTSGGDIWTATRATTSDIFANVRVLANVNSDAYDGPSWLSLDQCRLYMSSARGGTPDVYVAVRP